MALALQGPWREKEEIMACQQHPGHQHTHGPGCGHIAVEHEGHTDYLHNGHLHSVHAGHADEHAIGVAGANPAACTPQHVCADHVKDHQHNAKCGHAEIPHGNHVDFVVGGHLHHPHGDHCDDHGPIRAA
jgi:hypothetical protein